MGRIFLEILDWSLILSRIQNMEASPNFRNLMYMYYCYRLMHYEQELLSLYMIQWWKKVSIAGLEGRVFKIYIYYSWKKSKTFLDFCNCLNVLLCITWLWQEDNEFLFLIWDSKYICLINECDIIWLRL